MRPRRQTLPPACGPTVARLRILHGRAWLKETTCNTAAERASRGADGAGRRRKRAWRCSAWAGSPSTLLAASTATSARCSRRFRSARGGGGRAGCRMRPGASERRGRVHAARPLRAPARSAFDARRVAARRARGAADRRALRAVRGAGAAARATRTARDPGPSSTSRGRGPAEAASSAGQTRSQPAALAAARARAGRVLRHARDAQCGAHPRRVPAGVLVGALPRAPLERPRAPPPGVELGALLSPATGPRECAQIVHLGAAAGRVPGGVHRFGGSCAAHGRRLVLLDAWARAFSRESCREGSTLLLVGDGPLARAAAASARQSAPGLAAAACAWLGRV